MPDEPICVYEWAPGTTDDKPRLVYQYRRTPSGKLIVNIYDRDVFIGVSKKRYSTGEEAFSEINNAIEAGHASDVLVMQDGNTQ